MIFPLRNTAILNVYRCGVCSQAFLVEESSVRISCSVSHSPGSCCHFGERMMSAEVVERLLEVITDQKRNMVVIEPAYNHTRGDSPLIPCPECGSKRHDRCIGGGLVGDLR